jgi:FkbM family methyltransferase
MIPPAIENDLAVWHRKIREMGGTIDGEIIHVDGLTLKNCYLQFPLIVVENLYHQNYGLSLRKKSVVIDVGANAGVSALFLAKNPMIDRVICFEPLAPIFRMLQENLDLNRNLSERIEIFNFGLGRSDETFTINYSRDHAMSASVAGIYDRYYDSVDSKERIHISDAAAVVGDICRRFPDRQLILKMDCEGAEFQILPRLAECGLLAGVEALVVEFHDQKPDVLVDLLHDAGFQSFVEWARRDINIGMIRSIRGSQAAVQAVPGLATL